MTDSFSRIYADARKKFLDAGRAAGARMFEYGRQDVAGRDGEYLACDVAVLGNNDAPSAAIATCGTHGAEGYCGSAILHRWLVDQGLTAARGGVKVVLVHAVNPWAFSHQTRATENNVDLNRNFLSPDGFLGRMNPSYDRLAPFLHGSAADASDYLAAYNAYREFLRTVGSHAETESWEGQGSWPDGIYYSGRGPEWSNVVFRRILTEHLSTASHVGFIDWHTGIGQYGEVVPLIFDSAGSDAHSAATTWWPHAGSGDESFGSGQVPRYEGLLCHAIRQELPSARVAGAVMEFGTSDDYTVFRADRLDRWLRFEGRTDPDRDRLRQDYLNLCCPDDIAWRRFVLSAGPMLIGQMIRGVGEWQAAARAGG